VSKTLFSFFDTEKFFEMSDSESDPTRPTIDLTSEGLDYNLDSDTFFAVGHPDQSLSSQGGSGVYTPGEDADEDQDHGDFEDGDDEEGNGTPPFKTT
jgi:hypothetical protein